jgi:hypothetical protein
VVGAMTKALPQAWRVGSRQGTVTRVVPPDLRVPPRTVISELRETLLRRVHRALRK